MKVLRRTRSGRAPRLSLARKMRTTSRVRRRLVVSVIVLATPRSVSTSTTRSKNRPEETLVVVHAAVAVVAAVVVASAVIVVTVVIVVTSAVGVAVTVVTAATSVVAVADAVAVEVIVVATVATVLLVVAVEALPQSPSMTRKLSPASEASKRLATIAAYVVTQSAGHLPICSSTHRAPSVRQFYTNLEKHTQRWIKEFI
jgi:lysylphosphatidylglycerol synthetase-like protein (DUF2156 family)